MLDVNEKISQENFEELEKTEKKLLRKQTNGLKEKRKRDQAICIYDWRLARLV